MEELNLLQRIAVWTIPVLFAITVHEVAHGWAARQLGDPTAMMLGRLTLNPLKHIDPIGTVLLPGLLLYAGGFVFGWARPVPVTWENLRHPRRDVAAVAAAGPGANLVMALFWALVVRLGTLLVSSTPWLAVPLLYMGVAGIFINLILFVLNLLPILPLDGGRVVASLLPGPLAARFAHLEPYGLLVLLALLVLGVLGQVLSPVIFFGATAFGAVGGLPSGLTLSMLEGLGAL
jgi:Zn-dependent protease